MSRIGKHPVIVPAGVQIAVNGQHIEAKGKLGTLTRELDPEIEVGFADNQISIKPRDKTAKTLGKWGMSRTLVQNLVSGVTTGFSRKLMIAGVGYRAAVQGKELVLNMGYSHDVKMPIPTGLNVAVEKQTEITITGADKEAIGQYAANIRKVRGPEPYKGKGIRYDNEVIRRKEGKKKGKK